jgi:hypothetical protein
VAAARSQPPGSGGARMQDVTQEWWRGYTISTWAVPVHRFASGLAVPDGISRWSGSGVMHSCWLSGICRVTPRAVAGRC